jgi:hypothetical protein
MDELDLYMLGVSEYSDMDEADFLDMMGFTEVSEEEFYDEEDSDEEMEDFEYED